MEQRRLRPAPNAAVAVLWVVPDRRIDRAVREHQNLEPDASQPVSF